MLESESSYLTHEEEMKTSIGPLLEQMNPDEVIRLAQELVAIPSVAGEEGTAITRYISDWFEGLGLKPRWQEVERDRFNLTCRMEGGTPGPTLLLEGHQDTKPVHGMTIDPFNEGIRGGKLWGRGACDMKSALAGMMWVFKVLKEHSVWFRGTLVFTAEVGEECMGRWGADRMIEAGWVDADMAVVGEPSGLMVQLGNRGWWRKTIKVLGRATHSGTAEKGVNAILKMCKVVQELYRLPYLQVDDPIWGRSSLNVHTIHGGGRWSASVPDECTISIDSRLTPAVPPEMPMQQARALLHRMHEEDPEFRVDPEVTCSDAGEEAAAVSPEAEVVQAACRAVQIATGREAPLGACAGYTIASKLKQRGIPTVILGPGHIEQAHTADEWVDVNEVMMAARIYLAMVLEVLGERKSYSCTHGF